MLIQVHPSQALTTTPYQPTHQPSHPCPSESVLNDAVAIVLYETLTIFLDQPATLQACLRAAGTFLAIFVGSMIIGVGFALLASLAIKSRYFRSDDTPLESSLVVLLAYGSYMLADGLKLSGIVAILFCGMVRTTHMGTHELNLCAAPWYHMQLVYNAVGRRCWLPLSFLGF